MSATMLEIIHPPATAHPYPVQVFYAALCITHNKVKLINFRVSQNYQGFFPLTWWDSLFLLSIVVVILQASFLSRGILFQKPN